MKHFASALAGSEVDAVSSFEQFLCPDLVDILVEYPSFDISDTSSLRSIGILMHEFGLTSCGMKTRNVSCADNVSG